MKIAETVDRREMLMGAGSVYAAIISYTDYHSIPWMLVDSLFSWLYVAWRWVTR